MLNRLVDFDETWFERYATIFLLDIISLVIPTWRACQIGV
jgi:hypothetical protein